MVIFSNHSLKFRIIGALGAAAFALALSAAPGAQEQAPAGNGSTQQFAPPGNGNGSGSAEQAAMAFDLNTCQNVGPGLYQCPPSARQVCDPATNHGDFVCLRIDQNGVLIRQGMP